jgi:hypothetical protein
VTIHPGVIEAYTRAVDDLRTALAAEPQHQAEAVAIIRALIQRVEIAPQAEAEDGFEVTAYGCLAELLAPNRNKSGTVTVKLVAGEGLEPPTLGL